MNNRNCAIDSLEGIGMIFIMFVHFAQILKTGPFVYFGICGARSVQLIFIISGFLTVKSLEKVFAGRVKLKDWYIKKFIRLFPVFWIFTTVYIVCAKTGIIYANMSKWTVAGIVANYAGLNGLWPYYINIINVNWFFGDIILWYLISPLLLKFLNGISKTAKILAVYIVIYVAVWLFAAAVITDDMIFNYVTYQCLFAQIPYLVTGVLIYYLWEKYKKEEVKAKRINLAMAVTGIAFALLIIPKRTDAYIVEVWKLDLILEYILWGICFAILFWLQLRCPWKILVNKIWALFGRFSFGVYLSHFTIIKIIAMFMKKRELADSWQINMIVYVIACIASLAIAMMVENGVSCIIRAIGVKYSSISHKGE